MKFYSLNLNNFRNYHKLNLKFSSNINIFYGNNGCGKTNIVEAIYVLALTKSFRNVMDKNLISYGKEKLNISGVVENKYKNNYAVNILKDDKLVFIDNNKVNLIRDYIGKIPIIVFTPDDLKIIKDSPAVRRKFLNIDLTFFNHNYLELVSMYNKILKQRNSYLKQLSLNSNKSYQYLEVITEKLINLGLEIYKIRKDFIDKINNLFVCNFLKITKIDNVSIKYFSNFNKSYEEILKKFRDNYDKELNFGKTLYGIHLDDFQFFIDNHNVKEWASEGQMKNIILSLKLSELSLLEKELEIKPILILDDLFSELDKEKINNIFKILPLDCQIFITTTELSRIKKTFLEKSKIFKIINGNVVEE